MRIVLYIAGIMCFLALATLSYSQNYATRDVLQEVDTVKASIRAMQKQLRALNDEWAYLNRPERIKELTVLNYAHIQYQRQVPHPLSGINDIPFKPDPQEYDPSEAILE